MVLWPKAMTLAEVLQSRTDAIPVTNVGCDVLVIPMALAVDTDGRFIPIAENAFQTGSGATVAVLRTDSVSVAVAFAIFAERPHIGLITAVRCLKDVRP